ncbi:MAG: hypothetical protein ACTSW7_00850 [Candidatus Thorarchaeota archaeon]|nr:hypothetical protein [Thermoplasmatales archaeon]
MPKSYYTNYKESFPDQDTKNEELHKQHPCKIARDCMERVTIGEMFDRFLEAYEKGGEDAAVDAIDEDFLFGAWGHVMKEVVEYTFTKDLRGIIVEGLKRICKLKNNQKEKEAFTKVALGGLGIAGETDRERAERIEAEYERRHNAHRRQMYQRRISNKPVLNGIACPKCGKEMMDSNPSISLSSNPPQKNIHCPKCNYKDFRVK